MRRNGIFLCAALLFSALLCGTALGAGFALYDFSARGNALGGAMVGRADDPSAIAYNPAGITQIPGSSYMTGLAFIMPRGTVTQVGGSAVDMKEHTFIPPHFYYTRQMSDKVWFGVGMMTRFGLGSDYPKTWFGNENNYYANIESVSLNPNIAWKVNDSFSLSLGAEVLWMEYSQNKMGTSSAYDAQLKGDDIGYGWNVGMHFKLDEATRIGLHYRSQVKLTISGTVDTQSAIPIFQDHTSAKGDITLPEMYMFGISKQFSPKTNIEVGAIYTGWSSYDEMTIRYDPPLFGSVPSKTSPKNYKNVWRYQLGIEYKKSPEWTWRFGYTFDQSPIPDSTIDYQAPMSDRHLLSVGFGYTKNDRTWDFAYTYLMADDRTIAARPGDGVLASQTSNMDANIFVVSYSVKF
ncbi:MAG TPA: OmpP1/FadL family transporter [Synergistales bacterium]|nr:OmpP1/FadL family transporter [Synergistales bacterium]HRV71835.1 OmpP1/FadL family transporter [Thermovirgaceae bacterium]